MLEKHGTPHFWLELAQQGRPAKEKRRSSQEPPAEVPPALEDFELEDFETRLQPPAAASAIRASTQEQISALTFDGRRGGVGDRGCAYGPTKHDDQDCDWCGDGVRGGSGQDCATCRYYGHPECYSYHLQDIRSPCYRNPMQDIVTWMSGACLHGQFYKGPPSRTRWRNPRRRRPQRHRQKATVGAGAGTASRVELE